MNKIWKNYGLSITLFALFLVSWIAQLVFQYNHWYQEQLTHGEIPQMSDFWNSFLSSTFENWQSEFLQLFSFVVLATFLIHKNSPQSRDGDDKMQADIEQIKKALKIK